MGLSLSHHRQIDGLYLLPPLFWYCTLLFLLWTLLSTTRFLQGTHGPPSTLFGWKYQNTESLLPSTHPFLFLLARGTNFTFSSILFFSPGLQDSCSRQSQIISNSNAWSFLSSLTPSHTQVLLRNFQFFLLYLSCPPHVSIPVPIPLIDIVCPNLPPFCPSTLLLMPPECSFCSVASWSVQCSSILVSLYIHSPHRAWRWITITIVYVDLETCPEGRYAPFPTEQRLHRHCLVNRIFFNHRTSISCPSPMAMEWNRDWK